MSALRVSPVAQAQSSLCPSPVFRAETDCLHIGFVEYPDVWYEMYGRPKNITLSIMSDTGNAAKNRQISTD